MSLDSECDHVAVAVPSIEEAAPRWQAGFGGHWLSPRPEAISDFRTRQLRFNGGGKLELLEPTGQTGFAAAFLARFGARIHHVTLKVPDLLEAVETVRTAGYDVVDVSTERDEWHEGFLRPSQVGGVIVQLAHSPLSEEEWARQRGIDPVPTPVDGPVLLGPTFTHPDLDVAETVWRTLGAAIDRREDQLIASWPASPLTVEVHRGDLDVPPVLRFDDAKLVEADPRLGPATVLG